MPYTPTGPSLKRALLNLHPDPFIQSAILHLHRASGERALLAPDVARLLTAAESRDSNGSATPTPIDADPAGRN